MEKIQTKTEISDKVEGKSKALKILSRYNIQEGSEVLASTLQKIIIDNEKEITEGISRNFYRAIKEGVYRQAQGIDYLCCRKSNEKQFLVHKPKIFFEPLNDNNPETRKNELDLIWNLNNKFILVFTFNSDQETIDNESIDPYTDLGEFTGNEAFILKKISITDLPLWDFDNKKKQENINDLKEKQNLDSTGQTINYDNIKELLEQILHEQENFREAEIQIDKIFKEYKLPLEDAKKLKQSIFEFGNYEFFIRDSHSLTGMCSLIPSRFNSFVKKRTGIELKKCELTGAGKRRTLSKTPSETEDVHNASIYKSTIIIDWTSRQLTHKRKDVSIPEIIDLNKDNELINKIRSFEKQNSPL